MRGNTGHIHQHPEVDSTATVGQTGKNVLEITAWDLIAEHGPDLVGRRIWTMPNGGWPGGVARVIELYHDEGAPEIVLQVQGLEPHLEYPDDDRIIGVFDYERCYLLQEPA